jgi:hypothetical protein
VGAHGFRELRDKDQTLLDMFGLQVCLGTQDGAEVEQSLGTEADESQHREHERRGGLLTIGVILAIFLSSLIAAEISRGQSPGPTASRY